MKKVIDAVNELKADVLNIQNYNKELKNIHFNKDCEDEYLEFFMSNLEYSPFSKLVCTVAEFNACVDELSSATWIDGISLEEWKAGMKNTVIDSHGNELEIGKVYEFSDDGLKWFPSALVRLVDHEYQYNASNARWMTIRECQSQLGAIKKAPVKLVDGKAYQFEYIAGKFIGIYSENDDIFYLSNLRTLNRNLATNIIPLVPEAK